ncbi:MAG TPA: lysophospholipid acyltransferase family protein [Dehalococcoidia bacterium]|nr:lysophospholipid acyltransferase family protein [Dehalococcoidia bacterium]
MSIDRREEAAVRRWQPGQRWYHPLIAAAVINLSKLVMRGMNTLAIEGSERFQTLQQRGGRGLLTFGNHVSLFDDPLLVSNFGLGRYRDVRWVAADALNFFGSPFKAWLFTAGKSVPIVRGAGIEQPGLRFLRERLEEGAWVHVFPEGGRTRDRRALMTHPFKAGIGRLMAEARPLALPFYHYGMHAVLPVGAKLPRRGKTVRLVFGETIDCDEPWVREAGRGEEGPRLWEALAERAYEALRELELGVNPNAGTESGR